VLLNKKADRNFTHSPHQLDWQWFDKCCREWCSL